MGVRLSAVRFASIAFVFIVLCSLIQGCTKSRYAMSQDAGPSAGFDASKVPDAIPKFEVRTEAGNKSPYTVRGETYHVLSATEGFRQTGIGSWYGKKFHGYKTSNGEIYNMYAMTAAHKTLPIPSYVRVTNVSNGKSVVVRVNDRGPFHEGRIIDLSYAAAQKLGYANKGTAPVELEVITPAAPGQGQNATDSPLPQVGQGYFVQVGAFSTTLAAEKLVSQLKGWFTHRAFYTSSKKGATDIHRVRIGPLLSKEKAEAVLIQLKERNLNNGMIIIRPVDGHG